MKACALFPRDDWMLWSLDWLDWHIKMKGEAEPFCFSVFMAQDSWGSNTLRIMKHLLISSPDGEQGIFFFLNV